MIDGIIQPQCINIDEKLRLRKFDNFYGFAFSWYQDEELVRLVDGEGSKPYDREKLKRMYNYLNNKGELYFIEFKVNNEFLPIGDVTFGQDDMPIVIGENQYRGAGIGSKVIEALIERGKSLGYKKLFVNEIYDYNVGSQKMFEKCGFKKYKSTDKGYSFILEFIL